MKHPYHKNTFLKLSAVALLVITALIINSCRKDNKQATNPTVVSGLINADIPTLKAIYSKAIGTNGLRTLGTGNGHFSLIRTLNVNWNTYTLQKRQDSSIVAEFDMNSDTGLFVLKQLMPTDTAKYINKTTAVFIKYKDGHRFNFFTKIIEDLNAPGSQPVILQLHYGQVPSGFSGLILYYTFDQQYINGYHFTNGAPDGTISFTAATPQTPVVNGLKTDVSAPPTCTEYSVYEEFCTYGGTPANPYQTLQGCTKTLVSSYISCTGGDSGGGASGDPGNNGGGSSNPPNPCTPTTPAPTALQSVSNGRLIVNVAAPPPGGGSGGSGGTKPPPCPTATQVVKIDESKLSPCMQQILAKLQSLKDGSVAGIIQQFSGNIPGYNWTIQNGNLSGNLNGVTINRYDNVNGIVTTTFDVGKFSSASDLSIARTMLHESVHAYLVAYFKNDPTTYLLSYGDLMKKWNNTQNSTANDYQHDLMTQNFMNDIALALKEYGDNQGYNITDPHFYSDMAWGGLALDANGNPTSTFLDLVPNEGDRERILNTLSIEQSGVDSEGHFQKQTGKPGGC